MKTYYKTPRNLFFRQIDLVKQGEWIKILPTDETDEHSKMTDSGISKRQTGIRTRVAPPLLLWTTKGICR